MLYQIYIFIIPCSLSLLIFVSASCSGYRMTVQGVNLDHFIESRPAASDTRTKEEEAVYHNDLGVLLEREGDLDGALAQYRIARQKDPGLVFAYINAGNVLVKMNQLTEAEQLYRQALEQEPDQPQALNNLAWVLLLRGRSPADAIALLKRAIDVDRENRYLYLDSLGWALYRDGRGEEARETLTRALEETPPEEDYLRGETHYHLGLICRERGENRAADEHFKKSLEIYPSPAREAEIEKMTKSE
ncbi:MAG: tetratricopeptide repeat protein [PVC group bacterium]